MVLKIILFVCFIPIPIVMYFVMLNEVKAKKNLILGVTLPLDARLDDNVKALCTGYKRLLTVVVTAVTALAVPALFLRHDSVVFTYLIVWLIVAILLPALPYAVYNKKLKALKAAKGWYSESSGVTLVDTKVAAMPKQKLSILWFLPPILVSLIPVIHTVVTLRKTDEFGPMLAIYGSFAAIVILFAVFYRIIDRQKADIVDEDSSLSAALTQVRRHNWAKFWIFTAWFTGAFNLLFWSLWRSSGIGLLVAIIAYTVAVTAFSLYVELKTRNIQQKLTQDSGKTVYSDEDDRWIFGLFYYNPDDSHNMVNKRVGIGMTLNMAKAPGQILTAVTVILLLAMPLVGIWMMKAESTPVDLMIVNDQLVASHTSDVYKIRLSEVQSAELLDTLPSGTRTNGTAMENVLKGSFDLKGIGSCRLCLDPRVSPYIEVKTADHVYILGAADSVRTLQVYASLKSDVVRTGG